jgi:hypothetical protein
MFNAYYEKVLNADGIPILSTSAVADSALVEAGRLLNGMIGDRNDVRAALIENDARVGIIGENENTTDIPEHRYLKLDSATDWDARSRGFGGTSWAPITTAGEENLLCLPGDRYTGENIFIHEFAHTLMNLALPFIPGGDDIIQQVKDAYADAVMSGLWQNTYAGSNYEEYWAEGTQAYFGAQKFAASADGVHNEITTRAKLVDYDPVLADLVAEVMDESWSYDLSCGGPT